MNSKPRVCIVDDEEIITSTIETYLDIATEYDIITFNKPANALEGMLGEKIDVIISDFLMPEMNGLDFLSKAKMICPDAVMILLTGYADKENAIRAINELELFQYIEKPWDNDDLLMIIKNGIDKKNLIIELTNKVAEIKEANEKIIEQKNEITNLYELLKKDYQVEMENVENVIVALAKAIEAKDKYTEGHTDRVSQIAVKIGKVLKLSDQQIKTLKIGGIVHDIGKIGVPEHILNKPGKLSPEEYEEIKKHSIAGVDICTPLNSLGYILDTVRHHHEKLNGTGYPDALFGDQLTIEARIIAVADIYDALVSDRPYRKGMPAQQVRSIMISETEAGNIDTSIVDILLALMDSGEMIL